MRRGLDLIMGFAALLVVGFLTVVHSGDLPLGVEGEWQWPRVGGRLSISNLLIAAAGVAAYGGYAALGCRALGLPSRAGLREFGWVAGLTVFAVALQVFIPIGAPERFGLTKWGAVHCYRDCTGYYEVAKLQAGADPWRFFADYPRWVKARGATHLGTHPPGLIVGFSVLLPLMEAHPGAASFLNAAMPPPTALGFDEFEGRNQATIPQADRAAIYLTSLLTLLACAGTAPPLYLLARESLPPRAAWVSAAFWPLAPALNLFQPLADTAYPMLAAVALASAAWSARLRAGPGGSTWPPALLAIGSGAVMGVGMMFTLAFLPIGLIAALIVLTTRATSWPRRVRVIAWIGVGFLLVVAATWLATGADPFETWRWNLRHNSRFYDGGRRSYLVWLVLNPIETAVAAGLPIAVWGLAALIADPRGVPRATWCALAVLAIVDLSGRTLGEVARLWMIFLPPLFTAVGVGLMRLGGGTQAILVTILLMGLQTLGLQCLIQLVYPP